MKLIDKDTLVAEIKARISDVEVSQKAGLIKKRDVDKKIILFKSILSLIDTLEVKEVQEEPVSIDFEQELYKAFGHVKDFTLCLKIAKWFYNMGRNHQEPVSEELEECTMEIILEGTNFNKSWYAHPELAFKAGAKWQKTNLWKPADVNDLPDIDREVIAILDYDFGHYKVVYAHRPNPNGWNGTNIDTGEKEHFEPEIYDKGGWNQPHVLYWLDARLPYEEK